MSPGVWEREEEIEGAAAAAAAEAEDMGVVGRDVDMEADREWKRETGVEGG